VWYYYSCVVIGNGMDSIIGGGRVEWVVEQYSVDERLINIGIE